MTFTWYGNQHGADSCRYGGLGVIVPLLEETKVAEIINQHLPGDPQLEFDYGTTLSLLLAARMFEPTALSNLAAWATESGADILWEMPAEKITDDRLGHALDAFFEQRHSILAHLALKIADTFDIPLQEVHYDPTHILFSGAYADAEPRKGVLAEESSQIRSDSTLDPAHITVGRAMDDAPKGSKMIHVGLCTHVDEFGPLPLFGHTVDGNQNGRTAIDEQFALLQKHLQPNRLTMISDRGTYSVGHLMRLQNEGFHAICSAPWKEYRQLFDEASKTLKWNKASFLSIEQQRRRDTPSELPQEHYELAVLRHELTDKETKSRLPCRVIFVFSTADQKIVRQQRWKYINQLREELEKTRRNVARCGPYSDPKSVEQRIARLFRKREPSRYFTWKMRPITKKELSQLPPPGRGSRRPKHVFEYTLDEDAIRRDEKYDGYSALVTTVPRNQGSADALFTQFKQQTYAEQINRTFKGPVAVRPVFLHTPKRVEALVFLMIMALMLYYSIQRKYRQAVPEDGTEKEKRTTTRTILNAFRSYTLLIVHQRAGREVQTTRLNQRQATILRQLGFPTPARILSNRLPRPPT